jgi:hypothetical protein
MYFSGVTITVKTPKGDCSSGFIKNCILHFYVLYWLSISNFMSYTGDLFPFLCLILGIYFHFYVLYWGSIPIFMPLLGIYFHFYVLYWGFIYQGASFLAFSSKARHLFIDSESSIFFLLIIGFIEHLLATTCNYNAINDLYKLQTKYKLSLCVL